MVCPALQVLRFPSRLQEPPSRVALLAPTGAIYNLAATVSPIQSLGAPDSKAFSHVDKQPPQHAAILTC